MKNVVVISSSPRKGNSDKLCDEFCKGAINGGNNVKRINIRDIKLNFCLACRDCYNYGNCVQNDDMNSIYPYIRQADILVFSTPIYFGEMSGQLKTFLDRLYPLYTSIKGKQVYLIASCYENNKTFIDNSLNGLKRVLQDFGLTDIKQVIYGENTDEPNDITKEQLQFAYLVGEKV